MKRPASGTLLVIGFAIVAIGAIALNLYVNRGEGAFRPREPKASPSPSPARTIPSGDARPSPVGTNASVDATAAGIVMAEGVPFVGARVSAETISSNQPRSPDAARDVATSGNDGRFELGKLPPAPFRLKAEAPGWLPAWAEVGAFDASTRLEGFVLELVRSGGIRGRITVQGRGIAGANVFAGDETSSEVGTSLQGKTVSWESGEYALESVRAGTMTVAAFHPDFGFAAKIVEIRKSSIETVDLELAPLGRVRGVVVGPDGRPLPEVAVTIVDTGERELVPPIRGGSVRLLTVAGRIQSTKTDDHGRFELWSLMSRTASLVILADGYARYSEKVVVLESGEAPELAIRLKVDTR